MKRQTDTTMVQHLLIVARDRPDLWTYWREWFSGVEEVDVILDRRRGERKQPVEGDDPERRREDRRSRPGIDDELRSAGFSIITR